MSGKHAKSKAKHPAGKRKNKGGGSAGSGGGGGFFEKIPGLIKDVASIGSVVGGLLGTPIGAMASNKGVRMGGRATQLITAPAATGMLTRQPRWDMRAAPDVGFGPGIRISGRLHLGEFAKGRTHNDTADWIPYYGLSTTFGAMAAGDIALTTSPLSCTVLSPVSPFVANNEVTGPWGGMYGNSDNIIQHVATAYQRYKVVDATVTYVPAVSTADEHQLTISWIPDAGVGLDILGPNVVGQSTYPVIGDIDYLMSIPDSVTFNSWAPTEFVLPVDKAQNRELLYVNDVHLQDSNETVTGPDDADNVVNSLEARQLFPGALLWGGFGVESAEQAALTSYTIGTVFIDLTIDLYQMAISGKPALYSGATAPSLSDSKSGSISSTVDTTKMALPQVPFVPFPKKVRNRVAVSKWYGNRYPGKKSRSTWRDEAKKAAVLTDEDDYFVGEEPILDSADPRVVAVASKMSVTSLGPGGKPSKPGGRL